MNAPQVRLWLRLIWLVVVLFLYGTIYLSRRKKRQLKADGKAWPSVDARFDTGWVEAASGSCVARFAYDYFVEEYRSGSYDCVFSDASDANAFVSRLKGQRVPVRYNPANPDESVVEEADIQQRFGSLST